MSNRDERSGTGRPRANDHRQDQRNDRTSRHKEDARGSGSKYGARPDKTGPRNGESGRPTRTPGSAEQGGPSRRPQEDRARKPFRTGPRPRDLEAVQELDDEILQLIVRRATLLGKMGSGGRLSAEAERELRQSWERKATRLSKDKRLGRELFALLQGIDPAASILAEEKTAYNLSPAVKPVEINLTAPGDPWLAKCWMALAAATGCEVELSGLALTKNLLDAVKSLNILGGKLWWEDGGKILNKGGQGIYPNLDKVVQLGSDGDSLWLILAFCLAIPARLKIMGSRDTERLDVSGLSRLLPLLGARLTNVIPGQEGLPIRVESSGILPSEIPFDENVPFPFVAAMLLAAPFRDADSKMIFPETLAEEWWLRLAPVVALLEACGVSVQFADNAVQVHGEELQLPEKPLLPVDVTVASALLAMAALSKGQVDLCGHWPLGDRRAVLAQSLLGRAGLKLETADDRIRAAWADGPLHAPDENTVTALVKGEPHLVPVALVFYAAEAREGAAVKLPTALGKDCSLKGLTEDFLAQVGLEVAADGLVRPQKEAVWPGPWLSPSPAWAMGLALAAFLRPNLRLVNPGIMNQSYPDFWRLYNALPHPDLTPNKEPENDQPVRRRIIARGVYGELPPEPDAGND